MSNRPRPRPDRDDDITSFPKRDGSEKFDGLKADGAGRTDASEYEEIKWELKDDGTDRDGPWNNDSDHVFKFNRITEPEPDSLNFEEIKVTLKDDGTDRDGPWNNDGDHVFKFNRITEAAPDGDGYWVDDDGVTHVQSTEVSSDVAQVEIPELVLDDPTLDPMASGSADGSNDFDGAVEYQALPELDADVESAGSSDLGGEFFES